jgi:hypothetical protein
MTFRIECPQCHWGHEFKDSYINDGFLKGKCAHCGNEFFFKITVSGIQIDVSQTFPEGIPCKTLDEAKNEQTMATDPSFVMPDSEKLKHCSGCEDDFYNDHNPLGVKKCWSLENACLVMRKQVSTSQRPPWTQAPIQVLKCFHRQGYIYIDADRTN